MHDSDILSLLTPNGTHLTSLNLAESNITDISLVHLANSSKVLNFIYASTDDC